MPNGEGPRLDLLDGGKKGPPRLELLQGGLNTSPGGNSRLLPALVIMGGAAAAAAYNVITPSHTVVQGEFSQAHGANTASALNDLIALGLRERKARQQPTYITLELSNTGAGSVGLRYEPNTGMLWIKDPGKPETPYMPLLRFAELLHVGNADELKRQLRERKQQTWELAELLDVLGNSAHGGAYPGLKPLSPTVPVIPARPTKPLTPQEAWAPVIQGIQQLISRQPASLQPYLQTRILSAVQSALGSDRSQGHAMALLQQLSSTQKIGSLSFQTLYAQALRDWQTQGTALINRVNIAGVTPQQRQKLLRAITLQINEAIAKGKIDGSLLSMDRWLKNLQASPQLRQKIAQQAGISTMADRPTEEVVNPSQQKPSKQLPMAPVAPSTDVNHLTDGRRLAQHNQTQAGKKKGEGSTIGPVASVAVSSSPSNSVDQGSAIDRKRADLIDDLFALPFFKALRQGELTPEELKDYAANFYATTQTFMAILKELDTRLQNTTDPKFDALRQEIAENLNDETKGQRTHEDMRRAFFGALGLSPAEINAIAQGDFPEPARTHGKAVEKLLKQGSIYDLIGALVVLESMDKGFPGLLAGLERSLPQQFVINPQSSAETQEQVRRNREYFETHIDVDGQEHLPHLLAALAPLLQTPQAAAGIRRGMQRMQAIEKEFFGTLQDTYIPEVRERTKTQLNGLRIGLINPRVSPQYLARLLDQITSNPDISEFGGEEVFRLVAPSSVVDIAYYLMAFQENPNERSPIHVHPGERLLMITTGAEPAGMYVAGPVGKLPTKMVGDMRTISSKQKLDVVKITFRPYTTVVVYIPPNTAHAFLGTGFAALSTHTTDIADGRKMGIAPQTIRNDPNSMSTLTVFFDPKNTQVNELNTISAFDETYFPPQPGQPKPPKENKPAKP